MCSIDKRCLEWGWIGADQSSWKWFGSAFKKASGGPNQEVWPKMGWVLMLTQNSNHEHYPTRMAIVAQMADQKASSFNNFWHFVDQKMIQDFVQEKQTASVQHQSGRLSFGEQDDFKAKKAEKKQFDTSGSFFFLTSTAECKCVSSLFRACSLGCTFECTVRNY